MLPESLRAFPAAQAVEEFDAQAIVAGRHERGELTLEIAPEKIAAVCDFLKRRQSFQRLSTVTAVDRHPLSPRFEVVYHLHSLERNQRLRLKCRVEEEIDSVTGVWAGANWYEREAFDLFGVRFRNHPDLRRIMLPEDWEGHPLRKDYPTLGAR